MKGYTMKKQLLFVALATQTLALFPADTHEIDAMGQNEPVINPITNPIINLEAEEKEVLQEATPVTLPATLKEKQG